MTSRNSRLWKEQTCIDQLLFKMLCALFILQSGLPLLSPVITTYLKKEAEGFASRNLRINESCALIIQLIEHYLLTTIVIDALDECDLERRADLLETLETILRESPHLVKIFVSSRDDQDIVCHLFTAGKSCANFAKLMPAKKICSPLHRSRARMAWLSSTTLLLLQKSCANAAKLMPASKICNPSSSNSFPKPIFLAWTVLYVRI